MAEGWRENSAGKTDDMLVVAEPLLCLGITEQVRPRRKH